LPSEQGREHGNKLVGESGWKSQKCPCTRKKLRIDASREASQRGETLRILGRYLRSNEEGLRGREGGKEIHGHNYTGSGLPISEQETSALRNFFTPVFMEWQRK